MLPALATALEEMAGQVSGVCPLLDDNDLPILIAVEAGREAFAIPADAEGAFSIAFGFSRVEQI